MYQLHDALYGLVGSRSTHREALRLAAVIAAETGRRPYIVWTWEYSS